MSDVNGTMASVRAAPVIACRALTKTFGSTTALQGVSLSVCRGEIVGLIGRNGCGKTTLLHHVAGLVLPTSGECTTMGVPARDLDADRIARIGFVQQHPLLVDWMRVHALLHFASSFYARWDASLAASLMARLGIEPNVVVRDLSPGNRQKLALVLALAPRPELLLLDEPLSDLDPMARKELIAILLERFAADEPALVLSSHLLHDIEPIVNRIVCLERGVVTADSDLDSLKESYEAWVVTPRDGLLPERWNAPWILHAEGDRFSAQLVVQRAAGRAERLAREYDVVVTARSLNLEQLFPLLVRERATREDATRA